jgi:hypothetical protein
VVGLSSNAVMEPTQTYVVCQRRNSEAAYRRFFGPGYPGASRAAGLFRRPRVAAGLSAALASLGLAAWLLIF